MVNCRVLFWTYFGLILILIWSHFVDQNNDQNLSNRSKFVNLYLITKLSTHYIKKYHENSHENNSVWCRIKTSTYQTNKLGVLRSKAEFLCLQSEMYHKMKGVERRLKKHYVHQKKKRRDADFYLYGKLVLLSAAQWPS